MTGIRSWLAAVTAICLACGGMSPAHRGEAP